MKILLPCPACQHPLSPPRQASLSAQLRCPHCGHSLIAQAILVDNDQLDGAWEVVEDAGTENAFAAFFESTSSEAAPSSVKEFNEIQESSALVPQSNEWETQLSTIAFDESIETDAEFQIGNDHGSGEGLIHNDIVNSELESFDDRMMEVSDEPSFSPISEPHTAFQAETSEILVDKASDQQNDVVDFLEQEETLEFDLSDDELSFEESEVETTSSPNAVARRKSSMQPEFDSEEPIVPNAPLKHLEQVAPAVRVPVELAEGEEPFELQELVEPVQTKASPVKDLLGTSTMRPRVRKKSSPIKTLMGIVGGGMAAVPISILLLWNGIKFLGIEPMDPFDVGPTVASFVPWIVPESFRGSASNNSQRFPKIPFSPETSVANESRKFPPIGGGSMSAQPSAEPEPSLPVTPTEPSLSTGPTEPSLSMSATTTTELADASLVPSTSAEPAMAPSLDPVSIPPPSIDSITDEEKFDQTLAEFETALTHFNEEKPGTAAIVFHKLETLGEIIAAERAPSLKKAAWIVKATQCCETVIAKPKLLPLLRGYLKSDRSELFPDDIEILKPVISADFVIVDSITTGEDEDEWKVTKRAEDKILSKKKTIVPRSLQIRTELKQRYLVVGVVEEHPELKEHVFRVLFGAQNANPSQ